jgi:predicted O-linked N-acetylglucosamine transferase (SPINDLY family)
MATLQSLPRSVLILSSKTYHTHASRALLQYAADQGVRRDRIVFVKRTPDRRTYVDMIAGCDVMMDAEAFGAQTTAVDFLWAGMRPFGGVKNQIIHVHQLRIVVCVAAVCLL